MDGQDEQEIPERNYEDYESSESHKSLRNQSHQSWIMTTTQVVERLVRAIEELTTAVLRLAAQQ